MRLFLALEVPQDLRATIGEAVQSQKSRLEPSGARYRTIASFPFSEAA